MQYDNSPAASVLPSEAKKHALWFLWLQVGLIISAYCEFYSAQSFLLRLAVKMKVNLPGILFLSHWAGFKIKIRSNSINIDGANDTVSCHGPHELPSRSDKEVPPREEFLHDGCVTQALYMPMPCLLYGVSMCVIRCSKLTSFCFLLNMISACGVKSIPTHQPVRSLNIYLVKLLPVPNIVWLLVLKKKKQTGEKSSLWFLSYNMQCNIQQQS